MPVTMSGVMYRVPQSALTRTHARTHAHQRVLLARAQVFFNINSTNATQEDVIYANELFESLEWEGPVLKLYDLAIFVRNAF